MLPNRACDRHRLKRRTSEAIRSCPARPVWVLVMDCGAQGASRPRTGPSPPDCRLKYRLGSSEPPFARREPTAGISKEARYVCSSPACPGYTVLFATVVSQPNSWMNHNKRGPFVAPFTELLLEHGAHPNVRASLWKQLHPGHGDTTRHEYRDVIALSWGRRFHAAIFV